MKPKAIIGLCKNGKRQITVLTRHNHSYPLEITIGSEVEILRAEERLKKEGVAQEIISEVRKSAKSADVIV